MLSWDIRYTRSILAGCRRTFVLLLVAAWPASSPAQLAVDDTKFSPDRGFFTGPLTVTISSATPGAFISYTTDGSEPPASGGVASPVNVNVNQSTPLRALAYLPGGDMQPTDIDTHTYIVLSTPMVWNEKTYTTGSAYPVA